MGAVAIGTRFTHFHGQGYPVLEFDGQNQTQVIVEWSKIDFFLAEKAFKLTI